MSLRLTLVVKTTPGGILNLIVSDKRYIVPIVRVALPRGNKFYSIMDYLSAWPLLRDGSSFQKMRSFTRPPTQEEKIECIKSVTSVK